MIKYRLVIQSYRVNDNTLPGEKTLSTLVKWISEEQFRTINSYLGNLDETQTENKE